MNAIRQTKEHSLLFTQVMEAIEDYIVSSNLPPGAKLPSEREFAVLFNCSRTAIRETFKSLESIGKVNIQVGRGVFISEFGWSNLIRHMSSFISQDVDGMAQLIEARLTIEPAIIDLVIDKINDDDLAKLKEIVSQFKTAKTFDELAVLDTSFHQALMGITRNPLLTEFSKMLKEYFVMTAQDLTARRDDLTPEKYEAVFDRAVSEHKKLYEALKRRDREQAKELSARHILRKNNQLAETGAHGYVNRRTD